MATVSELNGLRSTISQAAVTAGLALSFAGMAQDAAAQQPPPPADPNAGAVELETINVEGEGEGTEGEGTPNTLKATTGIGRLPGSVQDTPQIINVIPKQTLEQQNVTSLEQALRNAPGITTAIGEGNGGMNGDQFRIRGFEAKGDIFTDGLRDFGVYVRDSFNYESVEVLKGPTSQSFGGGTTGGAINTTSKIPHLEDWYEADVTGGNGPLYRATFDANHQIDDTTAVRIVGMVHEQDALDRDHVFNDRYGVAASVGFGLGTDTTWTLGYFYQHHDRVPDYGIPVIFPGQLPEETSSTPANPYSGSTRPVWGAGAAEDIAQYGAMGRPITEFDGFDVDRSLFYGKETDKDIGNVHTLTSQFEKEIDDWLTFTNDSRGAYYTRDFSTSVAGCGSAAFRTTGGNPQPAVPYEDSCTGQFLNGNNPSIAFGGGNPGYFQESWGLQNVSTLQANFETGFLRHEVVGGADFLYQNDDRIRNSVIGSKGPQPILTPDFDNTTGYSIERNHDDLKKSTSMNVGVFISDRIWFTETLSVLGGVRWDYFDVDYDTYVTPGSNAPPVWTYLDQETDFFSPKASLIWEPTEHQTYYFSYATSASYAGQFPTNAQNTLADPSTGGSGIPGYQEIEPEENETYEAGGKIALFDGKLGLTAAAFQITKENAYYTDANGDSVATNEKQRARGLELGASGNITDQWTLLAGYTYLDSDILDNGTDAQNTNVGNRVPFVPEHAISFWTTYNIMPHFAPSHDGTLLVGGGVVWRDKVFLNAANNAEVPENFSLDALISYENDTWRVALNGYNLSDELNYDGLWGNRVIPSPGRAFTLTVGAKF